MDAKQVIVNPAEMTDVISDVVENLAMMSVDVADKFEGFVPDFIGHINFDGTVCGRLSVECTEDFVKNLAENVLGLDSSELEESHKLDAMGELLNIVCGNIVTRIFDRHEPFTLSVPEVYLAGSISNYNCIEAENTGREYESVTVQFMIDDFPVKFSLQIND